MQTTLELQRRLIALGYNPGPADGAIGPLTRKAIVEFQTASGLVADGVAGPRTWAALDRAMAAKAGQPAPAAVKDVSPPWVVEVMRRKGLHENRDFAELQAWLKSAGSAVNPKTTPWCFRGDVEILTEEGWQRFDQLNAGRVYQADKDGTLSLTEYVPVVKDYIGDLDVVSHQSFTLRADPEHRWWGSLGRETRALERRDDDFCVLSKMKTEGLSIPRVHAGGKGCGLDERLLRLAAAILADGTLKRRADGTPWEICIAVSRDHKIEALHELSPSHHYVQKHAYGPLTTKPMDIFTFRFAEWMHAVITPEKELDRDFINSMNQADARSFLESYRLFDGSQTRFHIYTSGKQRRDDLCQIALMAGWFVGVTEKTGGFGDRPCYEIHIKTRHENQRIFPENVSKEFFAGKLYCVTVPEHRIVVREHGRGATVTGNCGDLVETAILRALQNEVVPSNPMAAINWLKFGVELKGPSLGAILVFWRGSPKGWQGHVGFYVGEDATHYHVLGGNQSDAITITKIRKNRLRPGGIRWPSGFPLPTGGRVVANGAGLMVTENEA